MSEATTLIERPTAHPEATVPTPVDVLRISRVGLIASHLWVYLLPLIHGGFEISRNFWIGLAYVTVPLGLLIYGWNDYFDWDIDHISGRKNNRKMAAVFGPSLSRRQLGWVPLYVVLAQLPFGILWVVTGHLPLVGWLCLMALGNALYNGPGLRLSRVPILAELLSRHEGISFQRTVTTSISTSAVTTPWPGGSSRSCESWGSAPIRHPRRGPHCAPPGCAVSPTASALFQKRSSPEPALAGAAA